jgi:hypothetical protein
MMFENKMGDKFLRVCVITYIEKKITIEFTTDKLIDVFHAILMRKYN